MGRFHHHDSGCGNLHTQVANSEDRDAARPGAAATAYHFLDSWPAAARIGSAAQPGAPAQCHSAHPDGAGICKRFGAGLLANLAGN